MLVLAALAGCAAPQAREQFLITPYLQAPSKTGMTVRWSTGSPEDCVFRLGAEGPPGGVRVAPFDERSGMHFFRVRLADLRPGGDYRYTVRCGQETERGSFRTEPEAPGPFTFIVYGDSRKQPNVHARVAACFARHRPAFILHVGDMVQSGGLEEWPTYFFGPLAGVLRDVPVWPARGNHEGSAAVFDALFTFPEGRRWYSFDYGNVHVVCLDSTSSRWNRRGMRAWCKRDLAASDATWKFVFFHHPCYDAGSHKTAWGRDEYLPLFRKYGVDAVFTGHSHAYQRFRPMFTPGENRHHPILHVVTAGGGARLHPAALTAHTAVARKVHHYTVLRIDGTRLSLAAYTPDGTQIDALSIIKRNGVPDARFRAAAVDETTFQE
jgi:hypothetical protein